MNLLQAIANHFQIDTNTDDYMEWSGIKCPLPFHNDANPSAGLNFNTQMFNCFLCGAMPFEELASKLNITHNGYETEDTDWLNNLIEDTTPVPKRSYKRQAKEYADFLISRKLKPETIEEFGGYYESNLNSQDYGHLVIPYGKGKQFKRRIINAAGDTRFRQSRSNDSEDTKSLFGCNPIEQDTIILCEGVTDLFTLWQNGLCNSVTCFGANPSESQVWMLRGKTVFILFDRDYAGAKGAKRTSKLLEEWKAIPIILEIPAKFGNKEDEKIDINSAFVHSDMEFIDWIRNQLSNYHSYDTEYISNTFLANKRTVKYVATNIPSLDNALNGGFATGLHAIAGMPEAGKTSFKTYLLDTFYQQGQRVLSLDYELTKEQNYARIASRKSKHSWSNIEKDHSIIEDEVKEYLGNLSSKIRIEVGWDINQIKIAAKNFDIIIVDYIQRMPYEGGDEREGIKKNARELSNLTRDGKIVLIISSIPRHMYDKTGKGVFKETGDIEYICQSGYILNKIAVDTIELLMIKNTRGPSVDIYLKSEYANQLIRETVRPTLREMIQ